MANDEANCPVCGTACGAFRVPRDAGGFNCPRCGEFEVSRTALLDRAGDKGIGLNALERAVLSHKLRTTVRTSEPVMVTTVVLEGIRGERLPTRSMQAANLIRSIGDVTAAGDVYVLDKHQAGLVGTLNGESYIQLLEEIQNIGLAQKLGFRGFTNFYGTRDSAPAYDLTLAGWDAYERERQGHVAGRYGFLAMKFNDPALERFAAETVKPAVAAGIGYDLVDLRDVSRAGVIDNLLREQIRDAAFVLVDLTHDNSGAYWEAGYAEGLGKPVIYLCEKTKFDQKQTHFDTNHCTTVLWSEDNVDTFGRTLVATLRRSLNLFPTRDD